MCPYQVRKTTLPFNINEYPDLREKEAEESLKFLEHVSKFTRGEPRMRLPSLTAEGTEKQLHAQNKANQYTAPYTCLSFIFNEV